MESFLSSAMDSLSWATAALALSVCVFFYIYIQWSNQPRGPIGLPYLGYYPFLRDDFHVQLNSLSQKYGDVFCFMSTGQMYVHLGSLKAIKEVYIKSDCFQDKCTKFSLAHEVFGNGVGFVDGEKWKVLRKFFLQQLKELGTGKRAQEIVMTDFVNDALDFVKGTKEENFDALDYFSELCSKAVHRLLINGTKVDNDEIRDLNKSYIKAVESLVGKKILLIGPFLKYVLMKLQPDLRNYQSCKDRMDFILRKIIRDHEKTFDSNNLRDLIDFYINEKKTLEKNGDPNAKMFSEETMMGTLVQFIGDGGSTVGYMVALILQMLAKYPEIQKKIQQELEEVVGPSRLPSWSDKTKMTYTNAVLYECWRTCDFFPGIPSVQCSKETVVNGCRVPKGAIAFTNYWAALYDPDVYEEPRKFDPSRFLPRDDQKSRPDLPILFGIGKRSCIGESLVSMETFLFTTSILQQFDLHPATEQPDENKVFNITIRATPRKT